MKTFQLCLVLLVCLQSARAAVRTVHNNGSAQYLTIQAAIDASSSGDTVYVHGSMVQYAGFVITDKKLTVIGPGWAPDKQFGFVATVNSESSINGLLSTGSEIHGMVFYNTIFTVRNSIPEDLSFIRNYFEQTYVYFDTNNKTYKGMVFEGNTWQDGGISGSVNSVYQNFVIRNNYFYNFAGASINNLFNSVNVLFDHNLMCAGLFNVIPCFANCQFLLITNNIFVKRDAASQNSFSTFNNNITFNAGNNTPWASNGNTNAGGNIENQDPMMIAQTAVNAGTYDPLLDFTIPSGPANNSASDGKDMGLLYDTVGSLNWNNSRTSRLPFIYSMNITTPTIQVNGTLNVAIEARTSN
ncbi:MAG: hypothetical protein IPN29_06870 [Saprospiraceae bacterium]|nr:hypothetical protein [Saprospiraceae bacterium]